MLSELLYSALDAEYGVVVETDNVELLRQKLYTIRREDQHFQSLSLIVSPINGRDLWIVRRPDNAGG